MANDETVLGGGGADTVGNPSSSTNFSIRVFRAYPLLELKLDKQLPVEHFEATVSQSTVPSPPLRL